MEKHWTSSHSFSSDARNIEGAVEVRATLLCYVPKDIFTLRFNSFSQFFYSLILEVMNALNCRFIGEFEKGEIIGEGTYGIVFFAKDKNTNEPLAIKKMKVLDNQDGFPMTSLREVKILKMLSNHPNIVGLKDVVVGLRAENVFLVFEYCDIDLYKLMSQMMIDKATFSEGEIKCLSLQLIKGVITVSRRSVTLTRSISSTAILS